MVILVLGLPGSGKSYFAGKLSKKIDAMYLNSDRIRKALFPKRTYSEAEKSKVYEELLRRMQDALEKKKNVVLDATFYKNKIREAFLKSNPKIAFIEVWADEKIIKERLKENRLYSEADLKVYQLIKQKWEPLEQPHLKLQSTNNNIDVMLQSALNYLKDDKRTN